MVRNYRPNGLLQRESDLTFSGTFRKGCTCCPVTYKGGDFAPRSLISKVGNGLRKCGNLKNVNLVGFGGHAAQL